MSSQVIGAPGYSKKLVKLDGRTGEGGGQVVRIAACLAALTSTPIKIENVRGNRPGKNRGGLKAQHVAGIRCLADIVQAEVEGCQVGCKTLRFESLRKPTALVNRNILIKSDTAGSILMVLQTLLPFLIFAGDDSRSPITLTIQGGSNVSFSPSFEYADQVFLHALERFGINVERSVERRGWSLGYRQIGSAKFRFIPLCPGKTLKSPKWPSEQGKITQIDITIITPTFMHELLIRTFQFEIDLVFPGVDINFKLVEESRDATRMYALLVAHTSTGLRFGRDWLYDEKSKGKDKEQLATRIVQRVVDELDTEVRKGGLVDEHLQDQLLIFQCLAEGTSTLSGDGTDLDVKPNAITDTGQPFGEGSLHATTARWVISQILPEVEWSNDGRTCTGVGWRTILDTASNY